VLVSAGLVALFLHLGAGLAPDQAFVVGAMLAATDPAAVIATFKRLASPRRLATLVEAESLFNDGTGIVAFTIAVSLVTSATIAHSTGDGPDVRLGRGRQRRDRGSDGLGGLSDPPNVGDP